MGCGRAVALKKSRCSLVIKKPHLRHESRILQLLQSHPAIPAIYGYAHLPHFEYLAMELLGESVSDLQPDGTKIAPKTVVSVVLQTVSALSSLQFDCDMFPFVCIFLHRCLHFNTSTSWGLCTVTSSREI